MSDFKIDKGLSMPAYQQLYKHIKSCIENGTYKVNEVIPSEKEMQVEFGVSSITVRRAVSDLAHDGYLKKRRGAGTVVEPLKTERDILKFNSFGGSAKVKGDNPGSIILDFDSIQSSVKIAGKLGLQPGEPVYYLKRIRLLNGRIVGLNETYINKKLNVKLSRNDFNSETSLYELLEQRGIILGSADETMEAKMADSELRRDLFLNGEQPIVYKERITFDAKGRKVEFSENSYIAEIYKYSVHIINVREK